MPPRYLVRHLYPERTVCEEISCDDLTAPNVQIGLVHWSALRGSRPYPEREELDVRQLGRALESICLIEVIDDGADFLIRIAGDELRRAYPVPINGRLVTELSAELPMTAERWHGIFRNVVETGRLLAARIRVGSDMAEVNFSRAEGVCLPFGPPGQVHHLVTFTSHVLECFEKGQVA